VIGSVGPLNGAFLWHTWELFMCRAVKETVIVMRRMIMMANTDSNDIA
jgi:hypothetical protein